MSDQTSPQREHPNTYFVLDQNSHQEMTRLELQDTMLTRGLGGVLPELTEPSALRRVLDVGCGTGGWLIETATCYPMIDKLVGVDISNTVVTHARAKAEECGLASRVQFHMMDALRVLEFPSNSFDLVHQRAAASWLRTWEWTKILLEYQRISRPGGIIHITEPNIVESNSPALSTLQALLLETVFRSGRHFTATSDGLTRELVRLLTQHGIETVQSRTHTLHYQGATESGLAFAHDMRHGFRLFLPFFHKWTCVPDDYDQIYQQALYDMQQPSFSATWTWLTAWGTTPTKPIRRRGLS